MESIESKSGTRIPCSPTSGATSPKIKLNFNSITGIQVPEGRRDTQLLKDDCQTALLVEEKNNLSTERTKQVSAEGSPQDELQRRESAKAAGQLRRESLVRQNEYTTLQNSLAGTGRLLGGIQKVQNRNEKQTKNVYSDASILIRKKLTNSDLDWNKNFPPQQVETKNAKVTLSLVNLSSNPVFNYYSPKSVYHGKAITTKNYLSRNRNLQLYNTDSDKKEYPLHRDSQKQQQKKVHEIQDQVA